MFFDKADFTDYQPLHAGVIIANGTTVWTKGRGTVEMEWLLEDGTSKIVRLKDVLHVPDLTCGLFSISQATRKGFFLKLQTVRIWLLKHLVLGLCV